MERMIIGIIASALIGLGAWNLIDDLSKLHNALGRDYPEYRIPTAG